MLTKKSARVVLFSLMFIAMCACVKKEAPVVNDGFPYSNTYDESKFSHVMPQKIDMGREKVVVVNPKVFAWGAYDEDGNLVRAGIATAGADYCFDEKHPCRTHTGTFHIYSMRGEDCYSKIYPLHEGGALMPYCMFFYKGESLHGSPDRLLAESNISHGCIHIRIPDAEWLHDQFVEIGTKVVIMPY